MVFVAILETSRRYSPATVMADAAPSTATTLDVLPNNVKDYLSSLSSSSSSSSSVQIIKPSAAMVQAALITMADYGIGGTVAGLAGALARKTAVGSLTLTGMGLGLLAGLVQAASDAASRYYNDSKVKEKEEEQVAAQDGEREDEREETKEDITTTDARP